MYFMVSPFNLTTDEVHKIAPLGKLFCSKLSIWGFPIRLTLGKRPFGPVRYFVFTVRHAGTQPPKAAYVPKGHFLT